MGLANYFCKVWACHSTMPSVAIVNIIMYCSAGAAIDTGQHDLTETMIIFDAYLTIVVAEAATFFHLALTVFT